ncbi:MAG: ketopantoate reductase family protein, partial [Pseudomonas sp.]
MKICILGAGALGCAIGAALSEAGHQTWLLNRGREHVDAMNLHGLQVQDERGERQVRVHATRDANDVGVADLVVVLVKSFHTAEAIAGATALLGPQTLVLSL